MSLITGAARMGQRYARQRMTQRCQIIETTDRVLDPDTGQYRGTETIVYFGVCELVARQATAIHSGSGERDLVKSQPELRIPADVVGVFRPGCRVIVTTATGRVEARLVAEEQRAHRTARRFQVEVLE